MADLNLDPYLIPNDSPFNTRPQYNLAYNYDVTNEVPMGKITYNNLAASSRPYVAVISLSREKGTFNDIQECFNYVNRLGGGIISVLPGTYTISKPLTIYSNIILQSVSNATDTIFDFNNTTNNLSIESNGREIQLLNMGFKNCWNTSNGTIYGNAAAGITIKLCDFNFNANGSGNGYDIYFTGSSGGIIVEDCDSGDGGTFFYTDGLSGKNEIHGGQVARNNNYVFNGVNQTEIRNVNIVDAKKSIFFGDFSRSIITSNQIAYTSAVLTQVACDFNSCTAFRFTENYIDSDTGGNASLDLNGCLACQITSNEIFTDEANTPAILLTGGGINQIGNNFIESNGSGGDGIKITTDSDANTITGNTIFGSLSGTTYAVNIASADCNNNVVVGNALQANTADTNDSGTGSVIASNS